MAQQPTSQTKSEILSSMLVGDLAYKAATRKLFNEKVSERPPASIIAIEIVSTSEVDEKSAEMFDNIEKCINEHCSIIGTSQDKEFNSNCSCIVLKPNERSNGKFRIIFLNTNYILNDATRLSKKLQNDILKNINGNKELKLHISVTNWTKNDSTSKTWRDRATMYLNRAIEKNKNEIYDDDEHQNNNSNNNNNKKDKNDKNEENKQDNQNNNNNENKNKNKNGKVAKSCIFFETETILPGYFVISHNKSVEDIKEMNYDQVLAMFYNKNDISQIECIENELLLLRDEAQIAPMLLVWNSNKNNDFIKIQTILDKLELSEYFNNSSLFNIKMKNIDNGIIMIDENKNNNNYVNQVITDVTNEILGTNVESQSIVFHVTRINNNKNNNNNNNNNDNNNKCKISQILVKENTPFDSQVIPAIHKSIDESGVGKKESLKEKYDILTKERKKATNSVNKIWNDMNEPASLSIEITTDSKNDVSVPKRDIKVNLVVYDFDQTISCEHLYHVLSDAPNGHEPRGQLNALKEMDVSEVIEIFGGEERIKRLCLHFDRIEMCGKTQIGIVSFGYVDVIKHALEMVKLSKYFENMDIIGSDSAQLEDVDFSKAKCIQKMKKLRKLNTDQVCLYLVFFFFVLFYFILRVVCVFRSFLFFLYFHLFCFVLFCFVLFLGVICRR